MAFLTDNRSDLINVKTNTLILQPAEDIVAPAIVGEYLHKHIQGSTINYMKATGHFPHLSHPEETIELITRFIEKN